METSGRVLAQLYRICHRNWVPISTFHAPEAILEGFKAAMKAFLENGKKGQVVDFLGGCFFFVSPQTGKDRPFNHQSSGAKMLQ